jgi:hypothetical protein
VRYQAVGPGQDGCGGTARQCTSGTRQPLTKMGTKNLLQQCELLADALVKCWRPIDRIIRSIRPT